MIPGQVRQNSQRLTDEDAKRLLAKGINETCCDYKLADVALASGCEVRTISRAREQQNMLGLSCAFNLLDLDLRPLSYLAAAKGVILTRANAVGAADPIVAASATIHAIGRARDPSSPGGVLETDRELLAMEGDVDAAIASLQAMKARIVAAKVRLAA